VAIVVPTQGADRLAIVVLTQGADRLAILIPAQGADRLAIPMSVVTGPEVWGSIASMSKIFFSSSRIFEVLHWLLN
jgi:hypothetical protein